MTGEEQTNLLKAIHQFNHKWYYKNWIQYVLLIILSCIPLGAILVIPIIFFKWRYYQKHISSIVISQTTLNTSTSHIEAVNPASSHSITTTDESTSPTPLSPSITSTNLSNDTCSPKRSEENPSDVIPQTINNEPETVNNINSDKTDPISDYWDYWCNSDKTDFNNRIERARWIAPNSVTMKQDMCLIQGTASVPYEVTLFDCTCPDFQRRKYTDYNYPCKHMCRLAIEKNIIPGSAHTQEEIDTLALELAESEAEEERILSQYRLTDDEITNLLSKIVEPDLLPDDNGKSFDYFYSTSFQNKDDQHIDKLEDLCGKLEEQHDVKKMIPIIDKIQKELVSFKKLFYAYGQDGADEYASLCASDFASAKKEVECILRDSVPQNRREYYEELAYKKELQKDKRTILNALSSDSVPQATIINQYFPDCKAYARSLCKDLEDEGKIIRIKEGNRYILSKVNK